MNFLPKELEDIVLDYKYQLEDQIEHKKKMEATLYSIDNLEIDDFGYEQFEPQNYGFLIRQPTFLFFSYYLKENDSNIFIVKRENTSSKGIRVTIIDQ